MDEKPGSSLESVYENLIGAALFGKPIGLIKDRLGKNFMGYGTSPDEKIVDFDSLSWMIERIYKSATGFQSGG